MQERITSSLVLAFLVGCGTGDVVTDLETPVTAQISAPTSALLSCDLTVTVSYSAAPASGPINAWMWLDDTDSILGRDQTLDRTFEGEGVRVTKLRVFNASLNTSERSHTVSVAAPFGCVEAVVTGPNTLSVVAGMGGHRDVPPSVVPLPMLDVEPSAVPGAGAF